MNKITILIVYFSLGVFAGANPPIIKPEEEWFIKPVNLPEVDGVAVAPEVRFPSYIGIYNNKGRQEVIVKDHGGREIPSKILAKLQGGKEWIFRMGTSSKSEEEGDDAVRFTPIQRVVFLKDTLYGITVDNAIVVRWVGTNHKKKDAQSNQ